MNRQHTYKGINRYILHQVVFMGGHKGDSLKPLGCDHHKIKAVHCWHIMIVQHGASISKIEKRVNSAHI